MVEREYIAAGSITPEISTQSAALGEKKRGRPRQNLLIVCGRLAVLPTVLPTDRELADPDLFLSLKDALNGEVWRKSRMYFQQILPQVVAESEVVVLCLRIKQGYVQGRQKYRSLYYVPTEQAPALRDLLAQNRHLYEKKKKPKPKGPHLLSRLKPKDVDQVVVKLRQCYRPDQSIFYRYDPQFGQFLGLSRQTINDILTIARENGVIAVSHMESRSGRAYYLREEIACALEHFGQLRKRGEALTSTAKRLRAEAKKQEAARLTLRETADRLHIPPAVLRDWIIKEKVGLGNPLLIEAVRRRGASYNQRLFDPALLEDRSIQLLVGKYQERFGSLDGLTRAKFTFHRSLFSTLTEAARAAGLHARRDKIAQIAQILKQHGIKIAQIPYKNAQGEVLASYYVLAKKDKGKAVKVLREDPGLERFRQNPVTVICGPPPVPLPSSTLVVNRDPGYLAVRPVLEHLGVKIGRKYGIATERFFESTCPVTILKCGHGYYFPQEQRQQLVEYAMQRIKSNTGADSDQIK